VRSVSETPASLEDLPSSGLLAYRALCSFRSEPSLCINALPHSFLSSPLLILEKEGGRKRKKEKGKKEKPTSPRSKSLLLSRTQNGRSASKMPTIWRNLQSQTKVLVATTCASRTMRFPGRPCVSKSKKGTKKKRKNTSQEKGKEAPIQIQYRPA
jgi:hypothetical protein